MVKSRHRLKSSKIWAHAHTSFNSWLCRIYENLLLDINVSALYPTEKIRVIFKTLFRDNNYI